MRRAWTCVVAGLLACGGEGAGAEAEAEAEADDGARVAPVIARAEVEAAPGDPRLSQARAGIRDGRLAPDDERALRESSTPAHARARRILQAMAEPGGAEGEGAESDAEPVADASLRPPPIAPEDDETTPAVPRGAGSERSTSSASAGGGGSVRGGGDGGRSDEGRSDEGRSDGGGRARASASAVRKLAMRSTSGGAVLTIAAPSSLVVGVANQPQSGLVRLVIEKAQAGGGVLSTRPSVEGATVTAVRQGKDTVQITLRLDPGWRFGSVKPFSGGARVHLVGPP